MTDELRNGSETPAGDVSSSVRQKAFVSSDKLLSRSGGVARFSIAAFASMVWGGQSSPRSGRLTGGQAPEPLIAGSNAAVSC